MRYLTFISAVMLAMSLAIAGPGAHGPNGEHLDEHANHAGTGTAAARIETFTEAFELLGHLSGGELSIMIDRYETNEPVLNAALEVQYKDLKAKAKFHADMGDYAIDDPKFLAAISKPGAYPLLFTLVAGEESDLLEGTLTVPPVDDHHAHDAQPGRRWLAIAAALAVVLIGAVLFVIRRRRQRKDV